jgi:hypothetical protein
MIPGEPLNTGAKYCSRSPDISVRPVAAGKGGLHINTARPDRPIETFAVTVEPMGSTAAPTGPMVPVSKPS